MTADTIQGQPLSLNYTVFSDHVIGQSHVRLGMDCEDFSVHFSDPCGRYGIAAICDGHGDPRCFRASTGARFGCETIVDILNRFFALYYEEDSEDRFRNLIQNKPFVMKRIKTAFVSAWNARVNQDLAEAPIREEELAPLDTPEYRSAMQQYREGKLRSNIYGATLLAVAICDDFHIAMHIGDGIVVRLEGNGIYTTPLLEDDRPEISGPASMCDNDLLTRELAFRMDIYPYKPQGMFVTSDGIGDMPLSHFLKYDLYVIQRHLMERAAGSFEQPGLYELNEEQSKALHALIEFKTKIGVEDDCCLGGFYDNLAALSNFKVSKTERDTLVGELEESRKKEEASFAASIQHLKPIKENLEYQLATYDKKLKALQAQLQEIERSLGILTESSSNPTITEGTDENEWSKIQPGGTGGNAPSAAGEGAAGTASQAEEGAAGISE